MKFLCILAVIVVSITLGVVADETVSDTESRSIIGGRDAPRHPFYAFLLMKLGDTGYVSSCGGTIVTETAVVTAAHCLYLDWLNRWAKLSEIEIMVSDFTVPTWQMTATTYQVKKGTYSTTYTPKKVGSKNDIAVLVIKGKFNMRYNKALPICDGEKRHPEAIAIGLGKIAQNPDRSATVLQEAVLLEDQNCSSWRLRTNSEKQVCFSDPGKKAACSGDSGGPLVADFGSQSQCLLGITSFGNIRRCNHPWTPSVFTKASYFIDWVESFLKKKEAATIHETLDHLVKS